MATIAIIVVGVIVIFLLGVLAPRKSRRAQANRDRLLLRGEHEGDEHAGPAGDVAEGSFKAMRKAGDSAAEAGRKVHGKVTPD